MPPLIDIKNLVVKYEKWGEEVLALKSFSATFDFGDVVLITGANGSGKSSLIKAIAGITPYSEGTILIESRNHKSFKPKELQKLIYHIPQNPIVGTAASLTVKENLLMAGTIEPKHMEMLNAVGLGESSNQLVHNLSGGQRQLLSVIIAIVRDCSIFLFDEPTSALDPVMTQKSIELIQSLSDKTRLIMIVSHTPELWKTIYNLRVRL